MQFTSCQFLQLKEEFFICRVIFPHIFYVFKFSHHSTAFLVGTNSQCSSYIRHFFVYKAVVCQVVSPHKLKQKAFPAFDGAFFFLPLPFFFLCDAMWWRFLFLIRAPLLIKLYFFFLYFRWFWYLIIIRIYRCHTFFAEATILLSVVWFWFPPFYFIDFYFCLKWK